MLGTISPLHHLSVRIKRRGCTVFDHLKISSDAETTALVHKHVGPDELLVFVEGPTLQAFVANYRGCNVYGSHFEIAVAGRYRMKVVHFRGNYSAFNESNENTPETLYDVLLDTSVYLDRAVRTVAKTASASPGCTGHWIAKEPEQSLFNQSMYIYEDLQRKFIRGLPLHTWVKLSPSAPIHEVDGKKHTCVDDTNSYDWLTPNCTDPKSDVISPVTAGQLLVGKNILFIGDSHSRTLMTHFIRWACAANFPAVKHINTQINIPTTADRCGGLHAAYMVEYFCGTRALPAPKSNDLVLVNCGHHPAAGDGRYTLKEYREVVRSLVEAADKKGFDGTNFVWLESVPQPMRYDHWFRGYRDWRSYQRLNIYNIEANKLVQKKNFSVVESWSPTMPFIDKLCDNAHYGVPEALMPQFQRIMQKFRGG
jgi:hypothetical protein